LQQAVARLAVEGHHTSSNCQIISHSVMHMESPRLRSDLIILMLLPAPLIFVGILLLGVLVIADHDFIHLSLGGDGPSDNMISAQTSPATHSEQAYVLATIAAAPQRPLPISFKREVLPILMTRCVYCHGPDSILGTPPNGLLLDTYENVLAGSNNLPIVMPGSPETSTIAILLRLGAMPQNSERLSDEQVELISRWIAEGAHNY
jgi:hypothetical protein